MGATSHHYVERARALLDDPDRQGRQEALDGAQAWATLAVAAELHDLNTYLRAANNGAPLTQEAAP